MDQDPLSASLQHNIGKLSPLRGGTFTNLKLVGSELCANSANFEPDSQMGLSLVGPILHTPNNQPSTASSLVLVCSVYRRNMYLQGQRKLSPIPAPPPMNLNHRRSGRSVLIPSLPCVNGIWSSDQHPGDLRTLPNCIYKRVNPFWLS